jgi:phospholipase C
VHAGTSSGRVNNCDGTEDNCVPDPFYYDTRTIFNFLEDIGKSWKVYNDSVLISLKRAQFITQLGNPLLVGHFQSFGQFRKDR